MDDKNIFDDSMKKIIKSPKSNYYDVILITVAHNVFLKMGLNKISKFAKQKNIIFDIKNIFNNKNLLRL